LTALPQHGVLRVATGTTATTTCITRASSPQSRPRRDSLRFLPVLCLVCMTTSLPILASKQLDPHPHLPVTCLVPRVKHRVSSSPVQIKSISHDSFPVTLISLFTILFSTCFSLQRRRLLYSTPAHIYIISHLNLSPLLSRSTSASLPSQSFWGKFKGGKNKQDLDLREKQAQMALSRQRLLTLAFGDMETIRMVSIALTTLHSFISLCSSCQPPTR
jgi:hypothetical protein